MPNIWSSARLEEIVAKTNKRDATAADVARLRAEVRRLAKRVNVIEIGRGIKQR